MQPQFETKNYTFLERVQNVWNNPSELIENDSPAFCSCIFNAEIAELEIIYKTVRPE